MKLLQYELNRVAEHWSLYRIRPSGNGDSPTGQPDVLYFLPELKEAMNYCSSVSEEELGLAKEMCCEETESNRYFTELANIIMEEENLSMPEDAEEALSLYLDLVTHIGNL